MSIAGMTVDDGHLLLNSPWRQLLAQNGITSAASLWELSGETVKNVVKERGTSRCVLQRPNGEPIEVFIKRYRPIPLREKIKNIICFKPYKFDAFHEWHALCDFIELGLLTTTPLAAGKLPDGRSCIMTLGITDYIRASDLAANLPPGSPRRRRLILRLGELTGKMHAAGMAHQDLYLLHFFVREAENDAVYLIDLQRMIKQRHLSWRWRVKDLAQLLFSALPHAKEDEIIAFWQAYCSLTGLNPENLRLVEAIRNKAAKIFHRERRHRERRNRPGSLE